MPFDAEFNLVIGINCGEFKRSPLNTCDGSYRDCFLHERDVMMVMLLLHRSFEHYSKFIDTHGEGCSSLLGS